MNTNVQTIHQMGLGINAMVKQATGRESVSSIEHDWVSVEQLAKYIYGSDSGAIVSFDTNITDAIESLIAYITAVQDLHGYDSPWPAGGGANQFDKSATSTDNGYVAGKYLLNTGGEIAPTGADEWNISEYIEVLPNTKYILQGLATTGSNSPAICEYDTNKTFVTGLSYQNNASITFTTGNTTKYIRLSILQSIVNDIKFSIYSNICPITGWTGCTVTNANMLDSSDPDYHADTYSFTFPDEAGTVYGGTLDVLTGVLTVDKCYVKGSNCTWSSNATYANTYNGVHTLAPSIDNDTGGKSSAYVQYTSASVASHDYGFATANNGNRTIYVKNKDISDLSEFRTHIANIEFVYDLRTPVTYQLTPQQVSSLIGENNIYCSTGNVSVEYKVKEDLL